MKQRVDWIGGTIIVYYYYSFPPSPDLFIFYDRKTLVMYLPLKDKPRTLVNLPYILVKFSFAKGVAPRSCLHPKGFEPYT